MLRKRHSLIGVVLSLVNFATVCGDDASREVRMPARGICAHRGASDTHPENTLAALREAIRLGAQMIEFDVALSKDGRLVLMHDATVDRTTDGEGLVSELTLSGLKRLDAGSWKDARFRNERIPTLEEALAIMPENLWLNVHLKGEAELAKRVTATIVAQRRSHQAFLACGREAARAAKSVDPAVKICNMDRQANSLQYVHETIDMEADFIQLLGGDAVDPAHTKQLRDRGIRINYCCANEADKVGALLEAGVEFPLVDRVGAMLQIAEEQGIERLRPIYRSRLDPQGAASPDCTLPERHALERGAATEGIPLTARITHGPFLGHLTSDSVLVWARCSDPGEYELSASHEEGRHRVTAKARSRPERDGCVQWRLSTLEPASRYRYEIEFDGTTLVSGDDYFFETAGPESAARVRLVFGSCAGEDEGSSAVWRRMRAVEPHAVVLLGDTPYIDSTDLAVQRRRYGEFAAVDDFRALLRIRPLYSTWDDHDFGRNDTDGNLKGKENARRAFMEYRANPSYGDGERGIYTKFRCGGVEVFLLDTRFFAATEPSPFDQDRPSLLGEQQWRWLRRELKASMAPFKLLACGMIWNGAVRPGKRDHWATYPHELDALFDFIGEEKISGVVLVGGDVHRARVLRHHTIGNAGYKIPELITSPIHDSVIEAAKAPHPALVHDSGEPNTFLLVTVHRDTLAAKLNARFLDKDGRALFEVSIHEQELSPGEP